MHDLEALFLTHLGHHRADHRMIDILNGIGQLRQPVDQTVLVGREIRRQMADAYPAIFRECKTDYRATMSLIPGRDIRSTPDKAHPKRCPRNNHLSFPPATLLPFE